MTRVDVRSKVLLEARSVFARKGYRATTVSDIIAEVEISRGTFYRYFSNKRQVFFEIVHGIFKTLFESSAELFAGHKPETLESRLRSSLETSYRVFIDNRGVVRVYFREAFRSDAGFFAIWDDFERRMIALFSGIISAGVNSGVIRPVDERLIARAMFMIFLQVPYWDVLLDEMSEIDVDAMADEMVVFVMRGLSSGSPVVSSAETGR